ncbi:WD40 domain containing protein [Trichuris trichiura]|uniref:WD40 domain containing protein n=1 Tax=Trichuris trichiura TaxID=36087 RepID=A0A077Z1F4_TRITR|nr:WD40 domain containing protein [Trichuris trichiura]
MEGIDLDLNTFLEMGDDLTLAVVVWSEHYPSLQITSLCLLRHHGLVISGSSDGRLCLWKLTECLKAQPLHIFMGHASAILCMTVVNDSISYGHCAVSDRSGKLTLWDCLGRCSLVSKTMDHLAMSMAVHEITWCGKTETVMFCTGNHPEVLALRASTLENLFCLCSRVEPDWLSAFCLFTTSKKTEVVIGITNSGFIKMWSLSNANGDHCYKLFLIMIIALLACNPAIYEDESKQLQCYLAHTLVISPFNPRSLLLVTPTVASVLASIYDSSNFTLLCACHSPRGERWLGGAFVQVDKLILWCSDGAAFLHQLPRSTIIFAVVSPVVVSTLASYWKELSPVPTGMLGPVQSPTVVEKSNITCTLFMRSAMKIAFGRSDGSLVIASATIVLRKQFFLTGLPGEAHPYRILQGHEGAVTCLLYPYQENCRYDAAHLLSGGEDFSVLLWDLKSTVIIHRFCVQAGPIERLLVPPSDCSTKVLQSVCSVASDHSVALLNLKDLRLCLLASKHLFPVKSIHWRPADDFILISCTDGSLYVWQMETGHLDRVLTGTLAEEVLLANNEMEGFVKGTDETFSALSAQLFQAFSHRNFTATKEIVEKLQNSLSKERAAPLSVSMAPPLSLLPIIANGVVDTHVVFFNMESLIISLLVVEHGVLHTELAEKQQRAAHVGSRVRSESFAMAEQGNICVEIAQLLLSLLYRWGCNAEMDELCKKKLGLIQPDGPISFGFVSADRHVSLAFPASSEEAKDQLTLSLTAWLNSSLITQHLLAITSLSTTLMSMTYMSFIPELTSRRKLLKSSWEGEDMPSNAQQQQYRSNNQAETVKDGNSDLMQQLLSEQAEIKNLWRRVRSFHEQPYLEMLASRGFKGLDVELLAMRWQDRCSQSREAAQGLLIAELNRLGSSGREELVQKWAPFLPIVVDSSVSLFGPSLFTSQACTTCGVSSVDDKLRKNAGQTSEPSSPYVSNLQHLDSNMGAKSTRVHLMQMRRKQEIATVLLGVIGSSFNNDLMNAPVLAEQASGDVLSKETSIPFVACKFMSFYVKLVVVLIFPFEGQSLFECVIHPPNDALPLYSSLRRSCIDLLGRGFVTWQPYLDISKLVVPLLMMCAGIEQTYPSGRNHLPQSAATETAKVALSALFLVSHSRPSAFVTALSKESVMRNCLGCSVLINLAASNILSKFTFVTVTERNYPHIRFVIEHAVRCPIRSNARGRCLLYVADIIIHCLSVQLLKYKNVSEFCPTLLKFPMISFSANARRIAFGTRAGTIIVYELRAGKSQVMQAHSCSVSACCFSDDGKHLATYSSDEAKLNVWLMAQSFLGMGQSQAKCVRQFTVPNSELVSLTAGRSKIVWISQKIVTLMLPNGSEHRFAI